jgi:hypothetical protein
MNAQDQENPGDQFGRHQKLGNLGNLLNIRWMWWCVHVGNGIDPRTQHVGIARPHWQEYSLKHLLLKPLNDVQSVVFGCIRGNKLFYVHPVTLKDIGPICLSFSRLKEPAQFVILD